MSDQHNKQTTKRADNFHCSGRTFSYFFWVRELVGWASILQLLIRYVTLTRNIHWIEHAVEDDTNQHWMNFCRSSSTIATGTLQWTSRLWIERTGWARRSKWRSTGWSAKEPSKSESFSERARRARFRRSWFQVAASSPTRWNRPRSFHFFWTTKKSNANVRPGKLVLSSSSCNQLFVSYRLTDRQRQAERKQQEVERETERKRKYMSGGGAASSTPSVRELANPVHFHAVLFLIGTLLCNSNSVQSPSDRV